MAEYNNKQMEKLVSTELFGKVFWNNKDASKNRRFEIVMLNNSIQFVIKKQGDDKKFNKDRFAVTFPHFNIVAFINICREALERLHKLIDKGLPVEHDKAMIMFSGRNLKETNQKIEINVCSPKDTGGDFKPKFSAYIRLSKRNDNDKFDDSIIYLNAQRSMFRGGDETPARDYEAYQFFQEIIMVMEAVAARTSISRDAHMKKYLATLYGNNNDSNDKGSESGGYRGKVDYDEEDNFPL